MQVFVNISSGGCFYSEIYARQLTQDTSALRAPFLQRLQLLPETRGNMSHPFTLYRGVSFQKRSKHCCTTESRASSTLPWCGAQSLIQAIRHPSSHNACPPQLCQEGQTPIFTPHDEVPRGLLRTILDTSGCGKGSHPCASSPPDILHTVAECPLTCEWKKRQMTFPSHSKSLGQCGFYGARITTALVVKS
jgi:hypothetical protein